MDRHLAAFDVPWQQWLKVVRQYVASIISKLIKAEFSVELEWKISRESIFIAAKK